MRLLYKVDDNHFSNQVCMAEYPDVVKSAGLSNNFQLVRNELGVWVSSVWDFYSRASSDAIVGAALYPIHALSYLDYINKKPNNNIDPALLEMVKTHMLSTSPE